ncbi:hypothetical protein MAM1_0242d08608 [Mucor ambiguus]|uniref:BZIP domain-containing protein n=1 Tax=Mucor ambiguus TaxID=91626 RepID=A0A0C9MEI1_9FUNG|nr:hypothetical protein MAM1_0242d08608 [Mucor ambiguus]
MSFPSTTNTTSPCLSLPSSTTAAAAATAAYHRNQLSIPSLTCSGSSSKSRYASLSPPLGSILKSHRHHPYKMSQSMSHPGTSSASAMMMLMRSPPTSPPVKDYTNYYSPPASPLYHYNEDTAYPNDPLQERRQRNKEASAKYRQKKNMQQHKMRTTICQISDRNAILERQLQELKHENQQLRATADKLRGKLVASKLLEQWMKKHPKQQVKMDQVDMDNVVDLDDDDELLMYDL